MATRRDSLKRRSKRDWVSPKNITGGDGLELKKGIRIFPDLIFESVNMESFRVILWFGEKNDGNGERVEFNELLLSDNLKFLPKKDLSVYLPDFLEEKDWERYIETKVLEAILPRFNLDISLPISSDANNVVRFEVGIVGLRYIGVAEEPIEKFSEFLDVSVEE